MSENGGEASPVWRTLKRVGVIGGALSAFVAVFAAWDTICERFPSLARLVPFAECRAPKSVSSAPAGDPRGADNKTLDEIKATRKSIEDKLAMLPGRKPEIPLESRFVLTPYYLRGNLTLSVQKLATDVGGRLTILACSRKTRMVATVGEIAYGPATLNDTRTYYVDDGTSTFLLQVEPKNRDPVTILTHWNLSTGTQLKPAVQKEGLVSCGELRGQY